MKIKRFSSLRMLVLTQGKATLIVDLSGHTYDVWFSYGDRTISAHLKRLPRLLRAIAYQWRYRWRWSPFPIYWERYSRDCDQFAVEWCERQPNGWTAYKVYWDAKENAEGPEIFNWRTKAFYEAHKDERFTRDHAAEQAGY